MYLEAQILSELIICRSPRPLPFGRPCRWRVVRILSPSCSMIHRALSLMIRLDDAACGLRLNVGNEALCIPSTPPFRLQRRGKIKNPSFGLFIEGSTLQCVEFALTLVMKRTVTNLPSLVGRLNGKPSKTCWISIYAGDDGVCG